MLTGQILFANIQYFHDDIFICSSKWWIFPWWQVQIFSEGWRLSFCQVKIYMIVVPDLIMNGEHFQNDKSKFYYERLRSPWWQVEIFMMTVGDYIKNSQTFHGSQSDILLWTVKILMMTDQVSFKTGQGLRNNSSNVYFEQWRLY